MSDERYSLPDQKARFANAKKDQNQRYLDITTVYDGSFLKGKRVAVTGANRGLGLELSKQLAKAGAKIVALVRSTSDELEALKPQEVIQGIDVTKDECTDSIKDKIKGGPIDIVSADGKKGTKIVFHRFTLIYLFVESVLTSYYCFGCSVFHFQCYIIIHHVVSAH